MFGKKQSEETKKKIGEKVRQRYYDGLVNPRKGIKLTEKQKKKISQNNSKTFVIKHPNGNIIQITNLSQYCKENNLNAAMMSRVSRGIAKHHKGYTTI